jgi:hypothetical protein
MPILENLQDFICFVSGFVSSILKLFSRNASNVCGALKFVTYKLVSTLWILILNQSD